MNEPKCCVSECETNPAHTPTNSSSRESQATALAKIAQKAHLFHEGEDCFAAIEISGHLENHALPSRPFRRWLAQEYFRAHQQAPNADALNAAINTIAGLAMFKSNEQRAFVRLATFEDRLYLDLCNPTWSVVEIGSDGWRLIDSKACPVRFRRARGMKPLPDPKCGGFDSDAA